MKLFLTLVLATIVIIANRSNSAVPRVDKNEYCSLSCGKRHTVCQRAPCKLAVKRCGPQAAPRPMMCSDRRLILSKLNKFRMQVAVGNTSFGLPEAANMRALSYNRKLEYIAKCWANGCTIGHDICRVTNEFPEVGQTIAYVSNMKSDDTAVIPLAIGKWIDELDNLNEEKINSFLFGKGYTNVSQLLWGYTKYVGCGSSYFKGGTFVVCNFAPGGNIEGSSMYKTGQPASSCAELMANESYPGLCGRATVKDQWVEPSFLFSSSKSNIETKCGRFVLYSAVMIYVLAWQCL